MVALDRTDRRILQALQLDAGISNQDLAEQVGLSPSPCSRRVKHLEEAGFIVGRVTLLDAKKLGLNLMALIQVSMDRHTPERFNNVESAVREWPEVLECLLITGQSADYQIKVVVADMEEFQTFLLNKLTQIEGVSGVHSSFVLRNVINKFALPVT